MIALLVGWSVDRGRSPTEKRLRLHAEIIRQYRRKSTPSWVCNNAPFWRRIFDRGVRIWDLRHWTYRESVWRRMSINMIRFARTRAPRDTSSALKTVLVTIPRNMPKHILLRKSILSQTSELGKEHRAYPIASRVLVMWTTLTHKNGLRWYMLRLAVQ